MKRIAVLTFVLVAVSAFVAAPRLRAAAALFTGHVAARDVTYCTVDGVDLKMNIVYPNSTGAEPAVVYVHGGGWTGGSKDRVGPEATELIRRGYVVASIDYRLAPRYRFPAQIEDAKCAIRYLRAHAATYRIDPSHIGVWGGSAGGHLVALLGLAGTSAGWDNDGEYPDQSSAVQAVVDYFGPADLTDPVFAELHSDLMRSVFGASAPSDPAAAKASPVTYVKPGAPPFLIVQGDSDAVVPAGQSQELYSELNHAGDSARLIIVENAGHGFVPVGSPISPSREQIARLTADFFDAHLK